MVALASVSSAGGTWFSSKADDLDVRKASTVCRNCLTSDLRRGTSRLSFFLLSFVLSALFVKVGSLVLLSPWRFVRAYYNYSKSYSLKTFVVV